MKKKKLTRAQQFVLDFAKFPYGKDFIFYYADDVVATGKFIQRCRTELSRMRKIIKDRKQTIIPFKMIEKEISIVEKPVYQMINGVKKKVADKGYTKVVLVRTLPKDDATEEIQEIFSGLMTKRSRETLGMED